MRFWAGVVDGFTHGRFELVRGCPDPAVDDPDGTPADVFFFDTSL